MTKTIFTFPGQGSQKVGMAKDLYDQFPVAKAVFDEADKALGYKISDIMFNGPDELLGKPENVQPAILVASIATLRVLEELSGKKLHKITDMVAGHSLGEYTALVAAESLTLIDAVRLVHARGKFANQCVEDGVAGMMVILGNITEHQIKEICKQVSHEGSEFYCDIANDNCPGQVVISGYKAGLEKAGELCKTEGAKRAMMLPVSTPTHSALMAPSQIKLEELLDETDLREPKIPFFSNKTQQVEMESQNIKDQLVYQITHGVKWVNCVNNMVNEYNVNEFVECGTANVLSGLIGKFGFEGEKSPTIITLNTLENITNYADSKK